MEEIEPGELRLQDLGYSRAKSFVSIAEERKAYYLSRLHVNLPLFQKRPDGSFVPFDLLENLKGFQGDVTEMKVWIHDGNHYSSTRLVIEKVPSHVREIRIRKLRQEAQKKGRTPQNRTLLWQGFNLHISNALSEWLPAESFRLCYSLRWPVELIFKNWKSNFSLHKLPNVKKERVLCTLYAKLIFIFITHQLSFLVRNITWRKQHQEVSVFRASKHFKITAHQWLDAIWNKQNTAFVLKQRFHFIEKNCLKSKQNTRIYPLEIMEFLSWSIDEKLDDESKEFYTYVNRRYAIN